MNAVIMWLQDYDMTVTVSIYSPIVFLVYLRLNLDCMSSKAVNNL